MLTVSDEQYAACFEPGATGYLVALFGSFPQAGSLSSTAAVITPTMSVAQYPSNCEQHHLQERVKQGKVLNVKKQVLKLVVCYTQH
jgi:hypothetical protein